MIDKSKIAKERAGAVLKTTVKVIVILIVLLFLKVTIGYHSWNEEQVNNIEIIYSKLERVAIPRCFEWDNDKENMTITIPDEYEGIKIDSLSGFVGRGAPVSFNINIPKLTVYRFSDSEELEGQINGDTIIYSFTVNLGKNIKHIDEGIKYKDYYYIDNNKNHSIDSDECVSYVVEYNYECSPENKWFYSKDGKIYDKKTDELID